MKNYPIILFPAELKKNFIDAAKNNNIKSMIYYYNYSPRVLSDMMYKYINDNLFINNEIVDLIQYIYQLKFPTLTLRRAECLRINFLRNVYKKIICEPHRDYNSYYSDIIKIFEKDPVISQPFKHISKIPKKKLLYLCLQNNDKIQIIELLCNYPFLFSNFTNLWKTAIINNNSEMYLFFLYYYELYYQKYFPIVSNDKINNYLDNAYRMALNFAKIYQRNDLIDANNIHYSETDFFKIIH